MRFSRRDPKMRWPRSVRWVASALLLTVACSSSPKATEDAWKDVRRQDLSSQRLGRDRIRQLWFDNTTTWSKEDAPLAQEVLEEGKNPGLGIRALHARGITGKGVTVAIIDQNLCQELDHPEYAGRVSAYHDVGTQVSPSSGSMHGPSVLSLLAGRSIGVAPDARIVFVAAPSWTADAHFQAAALDWILERNATLAPGEQVRAVSVSAAPSGPESPYTKNNAEWDRARERAERAGVLVLDCTLDKGWVAPGFLDRDHPEDPAHLTVGFPGQGPVTLGDRYLAVPNSFRTEAIEYRHPEAAFHYQGRGGLSWAIPYATGLLALAWQVNPFLSGETLKRLLFETALSGKGARIAHPTAFIQRVEGTLTK